MNQASRETSLSHGYLCRRHLLWGWWSLLVFATLGLVLEGLHGFKLQWYLAVNHESRRLMWTLAHTHGTLLAVIHLVYAYSLSLHSGQLQRIRLWSSACLIGASLFMPLGFFLGGLVHYGGDPGLGILLLPPGAVMLLIALSLTALDLTRSLK